jgi:hypothetical protein
MYYLDDMGLETEEKEYKVFTFKIYTVGLNNGLKMLESGIWKFNEQTIYTLKLYIQTYFPKYFASFSHPKSRVRKGKFYIGVADDGLVHGIPYDGVLTKEFIEEEIRLTLNKVRSARKNDDAVSKYMNLVKIEIFQLKTEGHQKKIIDCGLDEDYSFKTYIEIKKDKSIEEGKYFDYLDKKRRWDKFCNSSSQKICNIMNDYKIRPHLIDLIKKTSTSTTKLAPQYKNIYGFCDIKNDYWNLIYQLKSDKMFDAVTFETAEKIRDDKLNPLYWGLVWRDLKTIPLKLLKPTPYRIKYKYKQYSLLMVTQVPKMIPSWIKTNSNVNLYVIKITLPNNISSDLFMEYQDASEQWIESYRTCVDDNPCCVPI